MTCNCATGVTYWPEHPWLDQKTASSGVFVAWTNVFKWNIAADINPNIQSVLFALSCSVRVNILCHCLLMSVFLCQTLQMPPSPLLQETCTRVSRKLSWSAAAVDTPNLRTSPGHGTVISLSAAHTCLQFNSVWLSARIWQLHVNAPHCNDICAAELVFTWHWNVSQNIHKPLLTCIHMGYTPANNKDVCLNLKEGAFLSWLNSSRNKSYGVVLRNVKLEKERGRYFHTREGGKRHKEEQETHVKHLIIVPCFKYHSNAW